MSRSSAAGAVAVRTADRAGGRPGREPRQRWRPLLPWRAPAGSWRGQQRSRAAALLAPALVILVPFVLLPIALTFWISLHSWNMLTPITQMKWVGLGNYSNLLGDPDFRQAMANTGIYVGIVVVITVPQPTRRLALCAAACA